MALNETDPISLLGNIPAATVERYKKKGIFTILQLSHCFRLRRKRNRAHTSGAYLWELKALAIREQKTYVLQVPEIKQGTASIYIDFEGLPEENFIYLIGMLVNDNYFSFWANSKQEEEKIFLQLFELLDQYGGAVIYHYGAYETKALKRWKYDCSALVNILSFFRSHVYPPTYTNGLKDIAGWLGFEWQDKEASGLKSIEWRKTYENTGGQRWKDQLLRYNMDDCKALARVHQWLNELNSEAARDKVQMVAAMKKYSPWSLQNNYHFGEDFQTINKAAYFDYQHSKIYWRTEKNKLHKKNTKKNPVHHGHGYAIWQPKKINAVEIVTPIHTCPHCGHPKIYRAVKYRKFIVTDLKFTHTGIKQWVTEHRSGRGKCARCAGKFNDSSLRQRHYGDGIMAWACHLYVNYHISFALISKLLEEQTGIWIGPTYFNGRLYEWWQAFQSQVSACRAAVFNSPVIHIDETTVRLTKGKERGYVWAFSTTTTVFYHLTLTREAGYLQDWLKDYTGVIVTDFFGGYESLPVTQQRCLIHLIRDLNDELYKNPFDTEYKEIVIAFGQLLKDIVLTIDRHGLKPRFLKKHIKQTEQFYTGFVTKEYKSQLAGKCAKRLKKHWPVLWTFLSHTGVPWNNNNAEAAIKAFALHRRDTNGIVSEKGLAQYLSMLTIAQTCRFRNLSFLDCCRGKIVL